MNKPSISNPKVKLGNNLVFKILKFWDNNISGKINNAIAVGLIYNINKDRITIMLNLLIEAFIKFSKK